MYAIGSVASCDIQGFFMYLGGIGSLLYNTTLSIYYMSLIQFSMSEINFKKKVEPWCHLIANITPIAIGIYLLINEEFNFAGKTCYIAAAPRECLHNDEIDCERGSKKSRKYALWFSVIPFALAFIVILTNMIIIVTKVIKQKMSSDRWRLSAANDDEESKLIKWAKLIISFFSKEQKQTSVTVSSSNLRTKSKKNNEASSSLIVENTSKISEIVSSNDEELQILHIAAAVAKPKGATSRSGTEVDPYAFDLRKVRKSIRLESSLLSAEEEVSSGDVKVKSNRQFLGNTGKRSKNKSSIEHDASNADDRCNTPTRSDEEKAIDHALLYIGSFFMCYIFSLITRIVKFFRSDEPFALALLNRVF
ncbi:hypothetical protein CTEN210_13454 [Chaetoceros tenuissimus]|uniref:G-protein coupled receptors family 2 profile 2 domain-containing protein n=1 Tax=Chaetoceros tenuissimus TaxID=426638 RepID=A0AAD3D3B3_9STRA|nr:hypothetical protein CTEN210_13454 [Chaetoceros tenuissimus]